MDELYVVARRALLDALDALGPHRDAVIVVGAQALYLRVGEAEFAVAPYTEDADLALDPGLLSDRPPVEDRLAAAGFHLKDASVGAWVTRRATASGGEIAVDVDLLVPETVSPGKGKRAARLPGHLPNAARIVRGLEGALMDNDWIDVRALDPGDPRSTPAKVAGPAALLVAKLHKLDERKGTGRAEDKDALDVFRLLRATTAEEVARRMRSLHDDARSHEAARRSLVMLEDLFGRAGAGTEMAARAAAGLIDEAEVRLSCEALSQDLHALIRAGY